MRVDELVGIDLGLAIIDCHVPLITRGETCYLTHSYNPCLLVLALNAPLPSLPTHPHPARKSDLNSCNLHSGIARGRMETEDSFTFGRLLHL